MMLKSFLNTIKNEWNLMLKEKMIFIVVFAIPVIAGFIFGYEFSGNQLKNISMAVVDQDNSSFSRMIIQQFNENETFNVKYYPENSDELKKLMDSSAARVGMIIPKDFGKDVKDLRSPALLMLYDGSNLSLASTAKTKASEILLTLRTGTFIKVLEGKLNLTPEVAEKLALSIKFSSRTLYNPAKSFKFFFNPGLVTAVAQTGLILMVAVAIRREEIEKQKVKRVGYVLGKIAFYSLLGTVTLTVNIIVQNKIFDIPFRGDLTTAISLSLALATSVTVFGLLVSILLIRNKLMATTISGVLFIPNLIIVGYTWPYISLPKVYQVISPYFPYFHYVNHIRNLFLAGEPVGFLTPHFEWFGEFILITLLLVLAGICMIKAEKPEENSETEEEGVYNGLSEITAQ